MQWITLQVVDETGIRQESLRLPANHVRRIAAMAAARGTSFKAELAVLLERGLRSVQQGEIKR